VHFQDFLKSLEIIGAFLEKTALKAREAKDTKSDGPVYVYTLT
jgi:hypothetical protein